MKVIGYFGPGDFRYIDDPVEHSKSGNGVYLYDDEGDQLIYSFNGQAISDDVVLGVLGLIYSDTFEISKDGYLYKLSKCKKCWGKGYVKKLGAIRINDRIIKEHYPKKCSCYFADRLQYEIDLYYQGKDISSFDKEMLFVAYVYCFYFYDL